MRLLLVTVVALCMAVLAVNGKSIGNDPQYAMIPDETGWKLVNLNAEPELENFFTPETDIVFTLFTNQNPGGEVVQWNDPSWIAGSSFNPANPVRVTAHGWNGDHTSRVNTAVREALFQVGQFNVFEADWSAGAGTINYLAARNRVGPVGVVTGNLLRMVSEQTGVSFSRMGAIGHSLGAHVAGHIGKTLGNALGSIVALDAALPLFNINNPDARVAETDALYVESIHTNAGSLGFDEPLGHANFYPNWGSSQPGCGIDVSGNCAHARSHEFFAESITSTVGFWARRCNNYQSIQNRDCATIDEFVPMGGEPLSTNSRGVFFMTTNNASPFAQGRQ